VLGQAQGGFAMGVGYALLESLPLYEDGPGNGKWNLDQYRIARGSELPLNGLAVEVCCSRRTAEGHGRSHDHFSWSLPCSTQSTMPPVTASNRCR